MFHFFLKANVTTLYLSLNNKRWKQSALQLVWRKVFAIKTTTTSTVDKRTFWRPRGDVQGKCKASKNKKLYTANSYITLILTRCVAVLMARFPAQRR